MNCHTPCRYQADWSLPKSASQLLLQYIVSIGAHGAQPAEDASLVNIVRRMEMLRRDGLRETHCRREDGDNP